MAEKYMEVDLLKMAIEAEPFFTDSTKAAFRNIVNKVPAVDAVEVPCKIGDTVWAIRNFKGRRQAQKGVVGEMYFRKDMTLQIVVRYVARGKWGEVVFATQADAEAALNGERREDDG